MIEHNNLFDFSELNILVVDDQLDVRRGLQRLIGSLNCDVSIGASGEEALHLLQEKPFDIVFTDIKMEGISGVDLLNQVQETWPQTEVVMITGYGTIDLAVYCLQNGAAHFITKPFDNKEILSFVERIGFRILSQRYAKQNSVKKLTSKIIAVDQTMLDVLELVDQVAPSKIPVLIEGSSGTGKELIAHEIHNRSLVADKPFLAINCIALPDTLLESELFGYKKGAFTGAHKDTKGLFEQILGGTIFLDEVSSMSPLFQGKLLRVLQEKVIRPLGGHESIPVDFRLISASNQNLEEMVKRGEFREDLFFRLQVMRIELPSLNHRKNCIPALAEYFLHRAHKEFFSKNDVCPQLANSAVEALINHDWQGNVWELQNTIQRALIVCKNDFIKSFHLGFTKNQVAEQDNHIENLTYEESKQHAIETFQRDYVPKALDQTNGNVTRAAALCGLTRAALQRIMRKLNISINHS